MSREPYKPRRQHRRAPYFKIQLFDETLQVWRDQRQIFDTPDDARRHIRQELTDRRARVMQVERERRFPLPESEE